MDDPIGAYAPKAGKPKPRGFRAVSLRLLLLLSLLLAGCSSTPPEQALRDTLAQMQVAAESRDVDTLFDSIAEDFAGPEGMDRQTFRRYVMAITLRNQKLGLQLGPLDVKLYGERATVAFTAGTSGGAGWMPDRVQVYQVDTGWRMEDGEWKLVSVRWQPKL